MRAQNQEIKTSVVQEVGGASFNGYNPSRDSQ